MSKVKFAGQNRASPISGQKMTQAAEKLKSLTTKHTHIHHDSSKHQCHKSKL